MLLRGRRRPGSPATGPGDRADRLRDRRSRTAARSARRRLRRCSNQPATLHLDEARLRVAPDLAKAGAPVRAQRALVPARDPQAELLRAPLERRVVEAGLDERLREPLPCEVGTHAEAEAHLVVLAHEVEEADQ